MEPICCTAGAHRKIVFQREIRFQEVYNNIYIYNTYNLFVVFTLVKFNKHARLREAFPNPVKTSRAITPEHRWSMMRRRRRRRCRWIEYHTHCDVVRQREWSHSSLPNIGMTTNCARLAHMRL